MKTLLTTIMLLIWLLFFASAEAQVTCFSYAGGMVSCNTPNGITRQQDLGSGMGVFTDERGNITPYAVIPPPSTSRPRASERPSLYEPSSRDQDPYRRESGSSSESTSPLFLPGLGGDAMGGSPY